MNEGRLHLVELDAVLTRARRVGCAAFATTAVILGETFLARRGAHVVDSSRLNVCSPFALQCLQVVHCVEFLLVACERAQLTVLMIRSSI